MVNYPKELVKQITVYFKEEHNHYIDEVTAGQYLDSLADLYLCFAEFIENDKQRENK